MSPVKKMGSDTPASAMLMENRSKIVPRCSAEITPTVMPPASQRIAAPRATNAITSLLCPLLVLSVFYPFALFRSQHSVVVHAVEGLDVDVRQGWGPVEQRLGVNGRQQGRVLHDLHVDHVGVGVGLALAGGL